MTEVDGERQQPPKDKFYQGHLLPASVLWWARFPLVALATEFEGTGSRDKESHFTEAVDRAISSRALGVKGSWLGEGDWIFLIPIYWFMAEFASSVPTMQSFNEVPTYFEFSVFFFN